MLMRRQAVGPTRLLRWSRGSLGRVGGPPAQITTSEVSSAKVKSAPPLPTGSCSARWRLEHSARTLSSWIRSCSEAESGWLSETNISVPI